MALSWLHPRLRPRAKVLDVGCGTGWVTWYFRRRYAALDLDVVGMDCSPVMLDEARRVAPGADFRRGDVCALDHPDDTFDLVTTVYTLRNFPDLRRGVREMYRVTAPGGAVVILDAFPASNLDASGALPVARVHHALRRRPVHQRRQSVQVPQREHTVDDTSGGCGGDVAGMRGGGGVDDEAHPARRRRSSPRNPNARRDGATTNAAGVGLAAGEAVDLVVSSLLARR